MDEHTFTCKSCGKEKTARRKGQRFCDSKCRMGYWQALGKAIPATINSSSPTRQGALIVVAYVSPDEAERLKMIKPGDKYLIVPEDEEA